MTVPIILTRLAARQSGIVSFRQATRAGLSRHAIAHLVSSGRWVRVHPRIYVTHTGPLTVDATLWAAALYVGRGVALSHGTAATLHGWAGHSPVVHLTVPARRSPRPQPGLVIHRCELPAADVQRDSGLPVTSPLRTVLDVASAASRSTEALAAVALALQRKQVDAIDLRTRIRSERRRWRGVILDALDDVVAGSHSVLELAFASLLRRHGLPLGVRQAAIGATRVDMLYDDAVVIELDGRLGHEFPVEKWRDRKRDNANGTRGRTTLRFGWLDVVDDSCGVAGQVGDAIGVTPSSCAASCRSRAA